MQEPNTHPLESHLVACVQEYLAFYLFESAIFLCERLVAEFPSEANVYLLAASYHRSQQTYRAYHLLKGLQGPQSRYLYALCCLHLGKLTEAESALMPDNDASRIPNGAAGLYLLGKIYQLSNRHPVAIAYYSNALQLDPMMWCAYEELCLLGADHEAQQYIGTAMTAPLSSSKSPSFAMQQHVTPPPYDPNHLNHHAATATHDDDVSMNQNTTPEMPIHQHLPVNEFTFVAHTPQFTTTPAPLDMNHHTTSTMETDNNNNNSGMAPPVEISMQQQERQRHQASGTPVGGDAASAGDTPVRTQHSFMTPAFAGPPSRPPPAPRGNNARLPPSLSSLPPHGGMSPTMLGNTGATAAAAPVMMTSTLPGSGGGTTFMGGRKFLDEGKMRKVSSKLFVEPASILKHVQYQHTDDTNNAAKGGSAYQHHHHPPTAPTATTRHQHADDPLGLLQTSLIPGVPHGQRSQEGQATAVALLQLLGRGYYLVCTFRCKEAIEAFDALPPQHYHTGFVLVAVGRAYFEMVDYSSASKVFQQARRVDPYRLKGLEVYSTVLWHTKKEVELSNLAQETVSLDRQSPTAWCIMGNCFSLQKEHEAALRFFQRALQLDPTLPYAYTLCGHEYLANEDFEKGITCYRNAIRIDPRHYNAWFGMGHIYFRQEKYSLAEYHFRRAHTINDRSSVLRCYLGMALHKLKRNEESLEAFAGAIAADTRNPLARFEKAGVLTSEGMYEEALAELTVLRDIAPREASVLFHMGKVLKKLGRVQDALAAFCDALDLQPPSADTNLIKAAIDRVAAADAEEEEEM